MSQILSSSLLLVGVLNGTLVLLLLLLKRTAKPATHILMFFILLLLGRTLVYVLGKDALYDPHSWLYVPLTEVSLAYGPCLYLYLTYTVQRQFMWKDMLHWLPVAGQVGYYGALLLLPKGEAAVFAADFHQPFISKLESIVVAVSITAYLFLSWRKYLGYQHWLNTQQSNAEHLRMYWLRAFLIANSVFFIVWCGFAIKTWWVVSSFDNDLALFIAQSALLSLLAMESWRNADVHFPHLSLPSLGSEMAKPMPITVDKTRANAWLSALRAKRYWQDPQLTLSSLAARLGTNTSSLSAAINAECGENFNSVVNRLRVEYVCAKLTQQHDMANLLQLGHDAGFNSKNSFNRNFRKFTGMSPSQYRAQQRTKS